MNSNVAASATAGGLVVGQLVTLAYSKKNFSLLNAHSYKKILAEYGNNVLFSVQVFVYKKVDTLHFS